MDIAVPSFKTYKVVATSRDPLDGDNVIYA